MNDTIPLLSVAHRFGHWQVACLYDDGGIFEFSVDEVKHPMIGAERSKLTYLVARNAKVEGTGNSYIIHDGEILEWKGGWELPEGIGKTSDLLNYAASKYGIEINLKSPHAIPSSPPIVTPEISPDINQEKHFETAPMITM